MVSGSGEMVFELDFSRLAAFQLLDDSEKGELEQPKRREVSLSWAIELSGSAQRPLPVAGYDIKLNKKNFSKNQRRQPR